MSTMGGHLDRKLNNLLRVWPHSTVAVSSFLRQHRIYRQLSDKYQKNGWIKSIGHGAFIRSDDEKILWPGGLCAVQKQLKLPIHVASKSALEQQGYAHFVPVNGATKLILFGTGHTKLPAWFRDHGWGVSIQYYAINLFNLSNPKTGLTELNVEGNSVKIAAPERAIMEYLYQVPIQNSFEEAHLIMENLGTLRPDLVQNLLEHCKSIKAKRLFMFLAEYCDHSWLKWLNLKKVSLGAGNRVIAKGGILDSKYHITIPESLKKCKGNRP